MVLDYSKWDHVDVSDDSDIEVNKISRKPQAEPSNKVRKESGSTKTLDRERGTQGLSDAGVGKEQQRATSSAPRIPTTARQGNGEEQGVLPRMELEALRSECATNEYLLKRLESLLQVLQKYPENTPEAVRSCSKTPREMQRTESSGLQRPPRISNCSRASSLRYIHS